MTVEPIWCPSPAAIERARVTAFVSALRSGALTGSAVEVDGFESLYAWSVAHPERFWPAVWRFCEVIGEGAPSHDAPADEVVVGLDRMAPPDPVLGPRWFPRARLNFAENLLRHPGDRPAIIAWTEEGRRRVMTHAELRREVERCRAALAAAGVGAGDRVAGYLPNLPETVIAMLAAASLGAVWSSCSPDFGIQGVLDRFGQIAPRVLVCADGYRYAGKVIDCRARLEPIVRGIGSVERVVVVPSLRRSRDEPPPADTTWWDDWLEGAPDEPLAFTRLPFDHPLYIMYSSGTTGLPKCMVHGAGGTLLQHLKEHVLHGDLGPDDRIFYFTTCGWMMWNWLVSALAVGATVVLYDGAPLAPRPEILWDMAAAEGVTVFGTSAKYLALAEKAGLAPGRTHDLTPLRAVLSTGSPLAPHGFDYVRRDVGAHVRLSSISGGTDIISCFALGNPVGPVWRGELQTRGLAMAVEVWDEQGRPVVREAGELVCTRPFPSMPVAFWDDPDGSRYRAAYFEHFRGVWRHGDWATLTEHGGMVIHGRSDATLNPGGVRIGTADIYRQVETLPEVVECLVVGQDVISDGERDVRIVLFVRLAAGVALDEALRQRIRERIREGTSPHHVPRVIVAVADIPRTVSGKITELAVRDVIHGRAVKNVEALANPEALRLFADLPELRTG
ncbi:MAG TPA: acetoacetate--CoA ligase [Gemmatimonadaceae bacterium]|nr:acetoacetate--CoA ligase [Gemmatimonadaceae bacterium]